MNDRLLLTVWDENTAGNNLIGSIAFSINDIVMHSKQHPHGYFVWRDIYGAHPDFATEEATAMNMRPETGNHWKGRVLLFIECGDSPKPEKKVA
jgi:hypothetical protein